MSNKDRELVPCEVIDLLCYMNWQIQFTEALVSLN